MLKEAITLSMVVTMILISVPTVKGDNDAMSCIIVVDKTICRSGDTVEVKVDVFRAGEYVDPDQTPILWITQIPTDFRISDTRGSNQPPEFLTERISKGIFKTEIAVDYSMTHGLGIVQLGLKPFIQSDDGDDICLSFGREGDSDRTFDYIGRGDCNQPWIHIMVPEPELKIDYSLKDLSKFPLKPGDRVDISFSVEKNGHVVVPDSFGLKVYGSDHPVRHLGDGIYNASIGIKSGFENVGIFAKASLDGVSADLDLELPCQRYQIWVHYLPRMDPETVNFEVCVADAYGKAVQGVKLMKGGTNSTILTDENGKAQFSGRYTKDEPEVDIYMGEGPDRKNFDVSLKPAISDPSLWSPKPEAVGFDVEMRPLGRILSGEQKIALFAYLDGRPLTKQDIHYYFYFWSIRGSAPGGMIAHGVEMTDQGARFSVKVDLPEKDCIVVATFRVENGDHPENPYIDHDSTDGKRYDSTSVYFPAGSSDDLFGSMDRKLEFRTTPMRFGDRTSVYVEGDHEIEESYLGAFPGGLDTTLDTMRGLQDFEWIRIWNNPSFFETKDGIQGYHYLPDFLHDGKVTLIVAFQDGGIGSSRWNYVTLGEGEIGNTSLQRNETTKVTQKETGLVELTWIAMAVGLFVLIVRAKTDRRRCIG